jgi:phenylacetate-CoA ligase
MSDIDRAASAKMLTQKIKNIVGVSTKVSVGNPGTVERSQGKARRVIDKRPKE